MLSQLLTDLAEALAGVDVKATHDPRRLAIPGVLLYPVNLDFDRLDAGTATVDVDLVLVAKGLGTTRALTDLEQLLGRVQQLWDVPRVETVNVNLPNHSPDPLPGFRFTLTTQVTQE